MFQRKRLFELVPRREGWMKVVKLPKLNIARYFRALRIALLIAFVTSSSLKVYAQRNCATVEYNQWRQQNQPGIEKKEDFEKWMKKGLGEPAFNFTLPFTPFFALKADSLLTIPVVVHVIHNGEPVGTGSNISDNQILSQIAALNEDLRRLNADTTQTPSEFVGVAADVGVELVMALSDQEGLATTGIIRVQGSKTSWTFTDDVLLKSMSYWPAEDYLNIWVAPLTGGLLGYAQFPVSNLPGLENSPNNRLTDGIVIGYPYFGSIVKDPNANLNAPFDLGRTATHEVGHFLGLRHIWGDGNCSVDDFVDDTPLAGSESIGCPVGKDSCPQDQLPDMIQNYLDFSNDACMNIFTEGQKARMRFVLNNSPRRSSLPTSPGLQPPIVANVDVGIKDIISPTDILCTADFIPVIRIRNYGSDNVNTITSEMWINGQLSQTKTVNLSLQSLDTFDISFDLQPTPNPNTATFEFRIQSVNGGPDEIAGNNSSSVTVSISEFIAIPFSEDFSVENTWEIRNGDNMNTWEYGKNISWESGNSSMQLSYHNDLQLGEIDMLILPVIDLSSETEAYLVFDYAYAFNSGSSISDQLDVAVSSDCGNTFGVMLFSRNGANLGTAEPTTLNFIPSGRMDWKREVLDLVSLLGESGIIISFVGTNGNGNNIYIDNIAVITSGSTDVGIKGLESPQLAFCEASVSPLVTIENLGTQLINEVQVSYNINGAAAMSKTFNGLNLLKGISTDILLDPIAVPAGNSMFSIQVVIPGNTDPSSSNNMLSNEFNRHCNEEIIPFRQKFEELDIAASGWVAMNQFSQAVWDLAPTPTNQNSARLDNFNSTTPGLRNYLISPLIDLTGSFKASVFFEVSYATDTIPGEWLRVLLSEDNGLHYDQVLLERSSEDMSVSATASEWIPQSDNDWINEFIDLSAFVGKKIKLAFEISHHTSNNLYIDNIEFFVDDNPDPVAIEVNILPYPNPAKGGQFNITFNLPQKEEVTVIIIDSMGKQVFRRLYPNTLNQTYPFDLVGNGAGIYILKTLSPTINSSTRLFINP